MTPAEFTEREAFSALWDHSPRRNGVLVYPVYADITWQEADREAWVRDVKDRLGLICAGDER